MIKYHKYPFAEANPSNYPTYKLLILRSRDGCCWRQHGKHCKTSGGRAPSGSRHTCILQAFLGVFAMAKKWKSLTHVLFCACQCLWKILENHVNTDIPWYILGFVANSRHFHHSSLPETGSWQLGDYGLFVTVWILRHEQEGDLLKTLTGILQNGWLLTTLPICEIRSWTPCSHQHETSGVSRLSLGVSIIHCTWSYSTTAMQGSTIPTCCLWCLSRG